MNKKFFAALASATMAFTASGSIAVFADDFVEEKTPVVDGNVTPLPEKVKWNKENFGDLATKKDELNTTVAIPGLNVENGEVETAKLEELTSITFNADFKGEVKGLEYFTGLTTFTATADTVKVTNKTLDFSANTKLETLEVTKAADLTGITLPESYKNDDDEDVYSLKTLQLDGTKLTSLDLSKQEKLESITVRENENLKDITLREATQKNPVILTTLALRDNALETIDLDRYTITGTLNLSGNHIGALDLSKTTTTGATVRLGGEDTPGNLAQTFYVSEKFGTVNLKDTFENLDVEKVTNAADFEKETGVLTLKADETPYEYKTGAGNLRVKLIKANPMNRLYNPNSGEHFYTADLEEKAALVNLGWNDEGYGWVAPKAKQIGDKVVYRLYNPNAGDHHYTTNKAERDTLVTYGWKYEQDGWYSDDDAREVKVYRQYNPFANGAGSHNYTTDKAENDYLVSLGWIYEGAAWSAKR